MINSLKKKKKKKALRRSLVPGWNLFLFTKLITYADLLQLQICFPWNQTTSQDSQVTPVHLRNDQSSPFTESIYDLRCSCILWFFSAFKIDSQPSADYRWLFGILNSDSHKHVFWLFFININELPLKHFWTLTKSRAQTHLDSAHSRENICPPSPNIHLWSSET